MLFSFLLVCTMGFSQTRKAVSILGDSYSTFENYLQPDTNAVWYFQQPRKNNDVRSVDQTWWYKFIKESGYRLCVNNSFSGATICHTGYRKEDYSDRSFVTRMNNLGCPTSFSFLEQRTTAGPGLPSVNTSMKTGRKKICTVSVRLWLICWNTCSTVIPTWRFIFC